MGAIRSQLSGGGRVAAASAAIAVAAALLLLALSSRAPAAPSGGAQASGAKTVDIVSFAFHPGTLRVRRGAKVVFSNTASIAHTASGRRRAFEAGVIQPGHSVAVRFRRRGIFSYFCRIHPFMHGKIVVR